jgi:hypothetical protein
MRSTAAKGRVRLAVQAPTHKRIVLSAHDSNGDGILDTVVLTAKKGKRPVKHRFSV